MNEKLGWVRGFRGELNAWNRCQEVMQASLAFINRHGVYHGAAAKLKDELDKLRTTHPPDCELSAASGVEIDIPATDRRRFLQLLGWPATAGAN
jgi:hypothetical protein